MKYKTNCPCGATLDLEANDFYERTSAEEQMNKFRKTHDACPKRIGELADFNKLAPMLPQLIQLWEKVQELEKKLEN